MEKKVKVFMVIYSAVLLVAAWFTISIVNPVVFPGKQMLFNILPMAGFAVLYVGVVIGGGIIYALGAQGAGKGYAIGGFVVAFAISAIASNFLREDLLEMAAGRRGVVFAREVAEEEGSYKVPAFDARKRFPHLCLFIGRNDEKVLKGAFLETYKETFRKRFADLIDEEAIAEEGYREGLEYGRSAIRNSGGRKQREHPRELPASYLDRLKAQRLPVFVDSFKKGYSDAFTEDNTDAGEK